MGKKIPKIIDPKGELWQEYENVLTRGHTPFEVKVDTRRRVYTWEGEKCVFEIGKDDTTDGQRNQGYNLFQAYYKTLRDGTAFNDMGRSFMENQAEAMHRNWRLKELPELVSGRFNFTHNPLRPIVVKTALSLDLNAAYPHYLYSQGLMNDRIFERMMEANKEARLISIGMFNKVKHIHRFDGTDFGDLPETEYTCYDFGWIFQFARMGVLGRLEKVAAELGADFIHSWVDCVVFRDCPKVLQNAEALLKHYFHDIPYKLEHIKSITYWSEGDGKTPKMEYYKKSKGVWGAEPKRYLSINPQKMCNGSNTSFIP